MKPVERATVILQFRTTLTLRSEQKQLARMQPGNTPGARGPARTFQSVREGRTCFSCGAMGHFATDGLCGARGQTSQAVAPAAASYPPGVQAGTYGATYGAAAMPPPGAAPLDPASMTAMVLGLQQRGQVSRVNASSSSRGDHVPEPPLTGGLLRDMITKTRHASRPASRPASIVPPRGVILDDLAVSRSRGGGVGKEECG